MRRDHNQDAKVCRWLVDLAGRCRCDMCARFRLVAGAIEKRLTPENVKALAGLVDRDALAIQAARMRPNAAPLPETSVRFVAFGLAQ